MTTDHTTPEPENIRLGAPYDDPKFEALCREHDIWGTAQAALCAVFWRSATQTAKAAPEGVSVMLPPLPTPDIVSTDEDRETTVHSYSDELMEDYAHAAVELNADRPLHPSPARKAVDMLLSMGYEYGWDDAKNRVWTAPVALNGMREALIERLTFVAACGQDGVIAKDTYAAAAKLLTLDGNRPPPTEGADAWCQYIAGMIECYLTIDAPAVNREAAIAGIIQRRLHWLPSFSTTSIHALDCKRSHPHENMNPMCELRTVIARLENEKACASPQPPGGMVPLPKAPEAGIPPSGTARDGGESPE